MTWLNIESVSANKPIQSVSITTDEHTTAINMTASNNWKRLFETAVTFATTGTKTVTYQGTFTDSETFNGSATVEILATAPTTWKTNPANGHQYTALDCGTWTQCQAKAVELGGNLVTIRNAAENQWIVDNFDSSKNYWIGFTDKDVEGDWKWISGESSGYTNWHSGQPDNYQNVEDYAHINCNGCQPTSPFVVGQWNDAYKLEEVFQNSEISLGIIEKTTEIFKDNILVANFQAKDSSQAGAVFLNKSYQVKLNLNEKLFLSSQKTTNKKIWVDDALRVSITVNGTTENYDFGSFESCSSAYSGDAIELTSFIPKNKEVLVHIMASDGCGVRYGNSELWLRFE